jgi:hypothetical protein
MGTSADSGQEAVRAVMERYVDAVYRADVETLRGIFHPDAFMGGYLGDDLLIGDPEPFLLDVGGRPSMAEAGHPYQADISRVEVKGRAATATLNETGFFGSVSFVNYYGLLEVDGVWMIVSKTFASL